MPEKCQATAASGNQCAARPRPGRPFCLWHDPEAEALRREIARKGGASRSNKARARRQFGEPLTLADVQGALSLALRGVLSGRLEPGIGTAVATIARAMTSVATAADFEARLAELERAAGVAEPRRWTG